jgi:hypothetical protein
VKKLLAILLVLPLLFAPTSFAAPKKISVTPLKFIAEAGNNNDFAGLVLSQSNIVIFGSTSELSGSAAFVRAFDKTGNQQWKLSLDAGAEEIATAATTDAAGNIWVAGSFSPTSPQTVETATVTPSVNPDEVISEPVQPIREDMDYVGIWKVSPQGELLSSFNLKMDYPALITSIAVDKAGLSLAGLTNTGKGSVGLLLNCSIAGICNTPIFIGTKDTTLDGVIRASDGSQIGIGSSTEIILDKKVQGLRDGIIVSVAKTGKISKVIRSSAAKASRNWSSATNTFFFGGEVITGKKIESSVTKFSNTFAPTWTYRFASTGAVFNAVGPSQSHYAFFASTAAITNISGWNPKRASGLVIAFDSKGALMGAYSASALTQPRAMAYSKDLGLVVAGVSGETVSIFNLISR